LFSAYRLAVKCTLHSVLADKSRVAAQCAPLIAPYGLLLDRTSFLLSKLTLEAQSMITVDEVHDFGNRWFNTVMNGGSAADQAAFFLDRHSRIYVLLNRTTFSFEEHHKLHSQWIN